MWSRRFGEIGVFARLTVQRQADVASKMFVYLKSSNLRIIPNRIHRAFHKIFHRFIRIWKCTSEEHRAQQQ
jgi:hypothetical protein